MKNLNLQWVNKKAQEAKQFIEKEDKKIVQQTFLPGMDELIRAMPNHVARSSLFAPIARGRRKMHNGTIIVSRADAQIEYWGEQLDEADADIMLQLMYEARNSALGQPVPINRSAFLKAMGRDTGKQQYEWLHRRIKALTVATMFIETRMQNGSTKYRIGDTESFHIIQSFRYEKDIETYFFTIDPRWSLLFSNNEYAILSWYKRLQINHSQDLAKSLQRLIATSSDAIQRYSLEFLKERAQYGGRMRDFKNSLVHAMEELERLEIITGSRIEGCTRGNEQTVWTRI